MAEQYWCGAGVRRVCVAAVQLWSRPKAAQQCCHRTSGGRREGGKETAWEGGDRLGFYQLFHCFGDVAPPRLSVICPPCFTSTLLSARKTWAARNSISHLSGVQGREDCKHATFVFS